MKHTFVYMLFCIVLLLACNNQNKPVKKEASTDSLVNMGAGYPDSSYQKGARLIAANDCLTCHNVDQKSVGPSYNEISERYENNEGNVENLAHSIIHGSKGYWGGNTMTPHSNISNDDAKVMARYILSLKHVPSTHPNK